MEATESYDMSFDYSHKQGAAIFVTVQKPMGPKVANDDDDDEGDAGDECDEGDEGVWLLETHGNRRAPMAIV